MKIPRLISRFSSFVAIALILLTSAPALAQEPDLSEVQTSGMETFFRWFRAAFDPLMPIVLVGVGLLAGGLFVWIVARAFIMAFRRMRGGVADEDDDDTLSTWDEEMGGGVQTSVQPTQREQDRSSSPAAPAAPQVSRRQRKKEKEEQGWSLFEPEQRGRKRKREDQPVFNFGQPERRGRRAPREPAPVFGGGGDFFGGGSSRRKGSRGGGIDISPAGGFSLLGTESRRRRR